MNIYKEKLVTYNFAKLLMEQATKPKEQRLGYIYVNEMKSDTDPNTLPRGPGGKAHQLKESFDKVSDPGFALSELNEGYLCLFAPKKGKTFKEPILGISEMEDFIDLWVKFYAKLSRSSPGASAASGGSTKISLMPADEICFYVIFDHDPAYLGTPRASGPFKYIFNPFDVQIFRNGIGKAIDGASYKGIGSIPMAILGKEFEFEPSRALKDKYSMQLLEMPPPNYDAPLDLVIRQIEGYVNAYLNKFNIGSSRMTLDGDWTTEEDDAWASVVDDVYHEERIPGLPQDPNNVLISSNWKEAGRIYVNMGWPGYTPNPKGVLAFVVDGYNNSDSEGKKKRRDAPKKKSTRRGGSGTGRSQQKTVEKPQLPRKSFNDIKIKLQGRLGRNRKADVFIPDIKEILASNLKDGQMSSDGNVSFVIDSVAGGKDVSFGKGAGFFESPYSVVRAIQNTLRGLRTKGSIAVEIPRGDYS